MDKWDGMMDEFAADNDWTPVTAAWYRRRLAVWLEWLAVQAVTVQAMTPGQFTRLLNQMRRDGLSYSTRNGTYTAVANFYRWLVQNQHVQSSPFTGDNRPKRPRPERSVVGTVALDYIRKMIAQAEGNPTPMNIRNAAILRLLATTGMRRAECAGLSIPDIDFAQERITLRLTKYQNQRVAFLQPATAYALNRWLAMRPQTGHDKVFVTLHPSKAGEHTPLRPDAINKALDRMKREAGIGPEVAITPHMLRHTFASRVIQAGNPFALRELLGHSDIKTTEIYVHSDERELRRIARYAPEIDGQTGSDYT